MLNLSYMNLVELVCNSELRILYCYNNKLTKFIPNNKLDVLYCSNNPLTELKLNDNLKRLYCDINTKLTNIDKNTNIHIY